MLHPSLNDHDLAKLESDTFKYFLHETHPATSLTADSTREGAPSSIAVVGFAMTVYPIAVERGYLSRAEALKTTLAKLRFFYYGPDGEGPEAIATRASTTTFWTWKPAIVPGTQKFQRSTPQS